MLGSKHSAPRKPLLVKSAGQPFEIQGGEALAAGESKFVAGQRPSFPVTPGRLAVAKSLLRRQTGNDEQKVANSVSSRCKPVQSCVSPRSQTESSSRALQPDQPPLEESPKFLARHYSPTEIAELWGLSVDYVRRIFEKEPGVLVLGNAQPRRGKRSYTTLRIPAFVVERVHRRLTRV
jgi:hypothetical protein